MEGSFWAKLQYSETRPMSTLTQTYTKIDIRRVFENFQADLRMLALRTQAMELDHAKDCAEDIILMAQEQCLKYVHIQLRPTLVKSW